jgi:hypothetical protein
LQFPAPSQLCEQGGAVVVQAIPIGLPTQLAVQRSTGATGTWTAKNVPGSEPTCSRLWTLSSDGAPIVSGLGPSSTA